MATHLNLKNLKKINDKNDAKLHWMPCVIKSDGEAKVSEFFEPVIAKRDDGVLQASFRGYPLLGKVVDLPKNYTGVVLQQTNERLNEEAERDLYGLHLFDRFTYWNWDIEPSGNDRIISALDWLHVAEATILYVLVPGGVIECRRVECGRHERLLEKLQDRKEMVSPASQRDGKTENKLVQYD